MAQRKAGLASWKARVRKYGIEYYRESIKVMNLRNPKHAVANRRELGSEQPPATDVRVQENSDAGELKDEP